jgi:CheY-like chemotaxis protein
MLMMTDSRTVPCPTCKAPIDAATPRWCDCIAKTVSPACQQCGSCLCRTTADVQREFWRAAPASLLERRLEEQRRRNANVSEASDGCDVLVVDDDEEIRLIAAYMLEQMGYSVTTASSADEALARVRNAAPRIVLTDALMPKMDGRQMCQYIKESYADVKVVIMTSLYRATRYKQEAYKIFHADGYMAKPIAFDDLQSTMAKLVAPRAVNSGAMTVEGRQ